MIRPDIRHIAALASTLLLGSAGLGHASSPDAWKALAAKSAAACAKAANLTMPKVEPSIDFEGHVLRIVTGRYPQPHMKNAAGRVYCLFDKATGKTQISEAPAP